MTPDSPPPLRRGRSLPAFLRGPIHVSNARIVAAFAVAIATDGLQLALGPLGWIGADQALDLAAMLATIWLLGFHVLLLPTVIVEALPLIDVVPTWTGCVAVVAALRRREQRGR